MNPTPFPTLVQITPTWNASGSVQPFPVAPHTSGLQYPRQIAAADGTVYDDGKPLIRLLFRALSASEYVTCMTLAGVYTAKSAKVTIAIPDASRLTAVYYNGIAVQPVAEADRRWDVLRWYGVTLVVRHLVAI